MTEEIDGTLRNEPRNFFVTTLTQMTKDLNYLIFVERASVVQVFPAMKGIILFLNKKAQDDLAELYKKSRGWEANTRAYDKTKDIPKAYGDLMAYLHTGYLKEVNYATPKYGKQKLSAPQ